MSGFTKLFSSILDSSIWQESPTTKLVWITMLAMADRQGQVYAAIPGLASRAGVGIPDVEDALESLSSPDPYSRTKDHGGRRIVEIDGGWALLNHDKYRAERSREERNEYQRKLMAARRARDKEHASGKRANGQTKDDVEKLYQLYPIKKARPVAMKAIEKALKKTDFATLEKALKDYIRELAKPNAPKPAYPATWFNQERWTDEPATCGIDSEEDGMTVEKYGF